MGDGLTLEKLKVNDRLIDVEKQMAGSNKALEGLTNATIELKDKVGKQNGRIAKLEIWAARIIGAVGIIAFIIGKVWK